jgi:hypothetical protein
MIKKIHNTRNFNNYAVKTRTRIFQILSRQSVKLRDEKMQWKLQFYSNFREFATELSSFHDWMIKHDQSNEISDNDA